MFGHVSDEENKQNKGRGGHIGLTPGFVKSSESDRKWVGGASPVHKHGGRVGPCALQVGHGVPLVDAALLRGDAALVEGHPRESDAPWEVVESAGHLACFVEDLQGGPAEAKREKRKRVLQLSF